MIQIDKMAYSSSLREKSPVIKSLFAMITLAITIMVRTGCFSIIVLLIMGYSTVKYCRITLKEYLKFMLIPGTFLLISTVAIIFNISKNPMDINIISGQEYFLGIMKSDVFYALELMAVCISSLSCLFFLSATTPLQDMIFLMRKSKIPWLFIELTVLIYRYIFIIGNMVSTTVLAQNCRLGNTTFKRKMKDMPQMITSVFIRALDKSNKMYEAMEARCYNGKIEVLWESQKASKKEIISLSGYILILVILAVICY